MIKENEERSGRKMDLGNDIFSSYDYFFLFPFFFLTPLYFSDPILYPIILLAALSSPIPYHNTTNNT
jgi:hypothetical protein